MTSITGIRTTIREEDFFVFDAKSSQDSSCIIKIQDTSETVTNKRFQFDTHLVSFEVLSPGNTRLASGNGTAYSIILQLGLRRYFSISTEAIVVQKGGFDLAEFQLTDTMKTWNLELAVLILNNDVEFLSFNNTKTIPSTSIETTSGLPVVLKGFRRIEILEDTEPSVGRTNPQVKDTGKLELYNWEQWVYSKSFVNVADGGL